MKAIIVAAGAGRRLLPFTEECPKCLLQAGSRRIIDMTMDNLKKCGLKDIIMVVGHQQDKIRDYLGNGVRYVVNPIYKETNSMYSLKCAQDYFGDGFVYLHSDIVFERAILEKILSQDNEICLSVDEVIVDAEDMKVMLEGGLIQEVNKDIPLKKAGGEFIGIAKFMGDGVRYLKETLNSLLEDRVNYNAYFEYAVEYLIKRGHKVFPSLTKNRFYAEIDTAQDLEKLNQRLSVGKVVRG